jgi:hypothetical protein
VRPWGGIAPNKEGRGSGRAKTFFANANPPRPPSSKQGGARCHPPPPPPVPARAAQPKDKNGVCAADSQLAGANMRCDVVVLAPDSRNFIQPRAQVIGRKFRRSITTARAALKKNESRPSFSEFLKFV